MADPTSAPADILQRNVLEVFGETSRETRDAVIDELYDPSIVFQDNDNRVEGIQGFKDHVDGLLGQFVGLTFTLAGDTAAVGDLGRADWLLGPADGGPVASGTDVGLVNEGRLVKLWTFIDAPSV